jgi:hypothetical protein
MPNRATHNCLIFWPLLIGLLCRNQPVTTMATDSQILFENNLIEANRALIAIGSIDRRERDTSASETVRNCLYTYIDLLTFRQNAGLTPDQSAQLQSVLDRLKAHLRFFGQDI